MRRKNKDAYCFSLLTLSLSFSFILYGQTPRSVKVPNLLKSISADCATAIWIPLGKKGSYGPTVSPKGFGNKQDIQSSVKNDIYFFEKEHNSAWYFFNAIADGELILEIIPQNKDDDYDFLLFKYTDNNFCDNVVKHVLFPIRTNMSRSGKKETSNTGLSGSADKEFVHAGLGETFSKSVHVKKGEKYYLVLDNVYSGGDGHIIKLNYVKEVEMSGVVKGEYNNPIKAEVYVEDMSGKQVEKTESDSITGAFKFNAKLKEGEKYTLNFYNDSTFLRDTLITAEMLSRNNYIMKDMRTILPSLKGGKKYILSAINFFPALAVLLPKSEPSVHALYKLMKKNRKMIICIEGHINSPGNANDKKSFFLSEARAKVVYDYLKARGIEEERISFIGYGSTRMLYPNPVNDKEHEANRRVEINVISLK